MVNYGCINHWCSHQLPIHKSISRYAFCLPHADEFNKHYRVCVDIDICFIGSNLYAGMEGIKIKSRGWIEGGVILPLILKTPSSVHTNEGAFVC